MAASASLRRSSTSRRFTCKLPASVSVYPRNDIDAIAAAGQPPRTRTPIAHVVALPGRLALLWHRVPTLFTEELPQVLAHIAQVIGSSGPDQCSAAPQRSACSLTHDQIRALDTRDAHRRRLAWRTRRIEIARSCCPQAGIARALRPISSIRSPTPTSFHSSTALRAMAAASTSAFFNASSIRRHGRSAADRNSNPRACAARCHRRSARSAGPIA